MLLVYITCKDNEEAKKIGKAIIEKRLAACANIFPISSIYRWEEEIKENEEFALILKTDESKFEEISLAVKEMHSYDIPCIERIESESNKEYYDWVLSCLK